MKVRCCAHCDAKGATNRWTLTACANGGRRRTGYLCDPCDRQANAWVLRFFRVPGAEEKLEAYRQ